MQIIDTNIVANFLLDGPFGAAARQLYELDPVWHSEPLLMHELTNVMGTAARTQGVALEIAQAGMAQAQSMLRDRLHPMADAEALAAAHALGISGYDARFICLARLHGQRLVTEDTRLRRAAPNLTQSLAEALAELA